MSLIVMQFCHIWPNMAVKGTRRPQALFEVGCFFRVRWFRFSLAHGAPLTFTLDFTGERYGAIRKAWRERKNASSEGLGGIK